MPRLALIAALLALAALSGCEMLGMESPEKVAAARDAEGRAVGGACRHAGRAIEDCYTLNRRVDKAAIFAGWRDMNDYMRENKIEPVAPVLAQTTKAETKSDSKADTKTADAEAPAAEKPLAKVKGKDAKSGSCAAAAGPPGPHTAASLRPPVHRADAPPVARRRRAP